MKKRKVSSFPLFFFFIFLFNLGTVIGARVYFSGLVFDPRVNLDEFGDEARYVTLDNCGVPPKDVFVHHVHCIPLPDNCNQTPVSGFTISRTSTYTLVSVIHRSIVAIAGSRIRATLNGVAFQSSDRSRALSTALLLPLPRLTYSIAKPILSDPSFFPLPPPPHSSHESKNERNDEGANISQSLSPSMLAIDTVWLSIGHVTAAVRIDPSHYVHVVGDERWNLTLENCRVPADRELIVNLNFEVLGDHWNESVTNREYIYIHIYIEKERKRERELVCRSTALIQPIKISMNHESPQTAKHTTRAWRRFSLHPMEIRLAGGHQFPRRFD